MNDVQADRSRTDERRLRVYGHTRSGEPITDAMIVRELVRRVARPSERDRERRLEQLAELTRLSQDIEGGYR